MMQPWEQMRFVETAARYEARVTFTRSGYPILHVRADGPGNPVIGGKPHFSHGEDPTPVVRSDHAERRS